MRNCDNERRVLDVYYTGKGTKIFVENGVLVEQTIKSLPSSQLGIHDGITCDAPPLHEMEWDPSVTCDAPPLYGMKWDPSVNSYMPSETPFSIGKSCMGYSPDPPPKEPPSFEEEEARDRKIYVELNTMLAKTALAYYNGRNRTKYELVDAMISNGFLRGAVWYHCNFTARNGISSESSQEGPCDSTTKLFFAELKVVALKSDNYKYLVTACRPIDGAKAVTGCEKCVGIIQHPSHGFRQGLHRLKPRALRPRNNGKVARKI